MAINNSINNNASRLLLPTTTNTGDGALYINNTRWAHAFNSINSVYMGGGSGNLGTSATNNVGIGGAALSGITSGIGINTAVGYAAFNNLSSGGNNIGIGAYAGNSASQTGNHNIYIGSQGASESNTIRIGVGNATSDPTVCYIAGIFGATVTGSAVLCSSAGLLGTIVSSERYKQDIVDLGDASSSVMNLRPVSFAYKASPSGVRSSGLIAEEVDKVMPNLVVRGKDGLPESVMYHELPALLLNEMKKMAARIEALEAKLK